MKPRIDQNDLRDLSEFLYLYGNSSKPPKSRLQAVHRGIHVQFIQQRPDYSAGFAEYISLYGKLQRSQAKGTLAMLLARIQRDLFDFTSQGDPEDFGPLLNFWYQANTRALSAALTAQPGLKLIIDAPSVRSLEQMSQKLFLLADTIVLRGLSPEPPRDLELLERRHLTPTSNYKPGYIDEVIPQLEKLRPSPLTMMGPPTFWTSDSKTLKNGLHAAYAVDMHSGTPIEIVQWISGPGRPLLESGRLSYAPFVPSLEMEQEFLRRRIDVSAYFNTHRDGP